MKVGLLARLRTAFQLECRYVSIGRSALCQPISKRNVCEFKTSCSARAEGLAEILPRVRRREYYIAHDAPLNDGDLLYNIEE
jgi:hypothetical protein